MRKCKEMKETGEYRKELLNECGRRIVKMKEILRRRKTIDGEIESTLLLLLLANSISNTHQRSKQFF